MRKLIMLEELAYPGFSKIIKILYLSLFLILTTGCSIGYLLNSGYHQQKIFHAKKPIEEILKDPHADPHIKKQLILIQEARVFAENELKLKKTKNYQAYVDLQRPYVTWIVRASEAYELKSYRWWFPIVGHVPYKGFFQEEAAHEEAKKFDPKKYDTHVRGVTAYSTLGWFSDPILSSMMNYPEPDLVELIIHESVHATIFIKGQADFNERLASFIGQEGTKLFYTKKEGKDSPTVRSVDLARQDTLIFSKFITSELAALREWYKNLSENEKNDENKAQRLKSIQDNFKKNITKKLNTPNYLGFSSMKLNNAILLGYETYIQDLSDFEKLFNLDERNFSRFLNRCHQLENHKNPQDQIKKWLAESSYNS